VPAGSVTARSSVSDKSQPQPNALSESRQV
jgi:hypothetical protein